MQDLMSVRECNGFADFLKRSQTFGKASQFIAALVEPPSLHQLHGVENAAIGQCTDVVYGDNSRMLELGDDFRLAQQTSAEFSAGVHDPEHFQRDLPAQGGVLHRKTLPMPPAPSLSSSTYPVLLRSGTSAAMRRRSSA